MTAMTQRQVASQGALSMVSHQRLYEGDGFVLNRSDGSVQHSKFQKHVAEFEIRRDDLVSRGFDAVKEALQSTVDQFAKSGHKMMYEGISEAVGDRAVDAGGRPFTAELYLEMLETIEFSFDSSGEWDQPALVIAPSLMPKVKEQLQRLDVEPSLHQRLSCLIDRKRTEWRDREARRQLVD